MGSKVGAKGQVVISKPTRDRLGIGPGWEALERIVDDHVELYFVPPLHGRSLKGSLAAHVRRRRPAKDWVRAREAAWARAAREQERPRRKR
jgi:AbrB family looped-hinge helix DNA binding protein